MMTRRQALSAAACASLTALLARTGIAGSTRLTRPVPATGELLPVIGLGTSRTFDVGADAAGRRAVEAVLRDFFAGGGTVIDSSPMYGSAETVVGDLVRVVRPERWFAATKVWTDGREAGIAQMTESARRMAVERFDLMQIHNLRDWRVHLPTLREWKAAGKIRYLGITTSTSRQYADLAAIMRTEQLDFVQLNYSIGEREAEETLLPLARDRGTGVLVNRPFMRAELFARVRGKALPAWAADIGCSSWGQVFLKWILGHEAVTCLIPATANTRNLADNLGAGAGLLPDPALRERIAREVLG